MALIYDAAFDSQTRVLSLLDKAGNVISSCEVPSNEVDDPNKPLMLRAIEDNSSVILRRYGKVSNTYQTSTNGTDWTDYRLETKIILNKGESVYFRCNNHPTKQDVSNHVEFDMTGKIEAWHNAYSMIHSYFSSPEWSVGSYGMYSLFSVCASLMKAPLLPSTVLANNCYDSMFFRCNSLTQAPELPAKVLESECYRNMFGNCSSLTKAPELPATDLESDCYYEMFFECKSLKEVRISATTTKSWSLYKWLQGVAATGDFYCDPNATIFPKDSTSGIPKGWTRHALADYPTTP